MITLKEWNTVLTQYQRERAVGYIYPNMPEDFIKELSLPWHHRLDSKHDNLIKSMYKVGNSYEVRPRFCI